MPELSSKDEKDGRPLSPKISVEKPVPPEPEYLLPKSLREALFGDFILKWYMTDAERCTLIMLLNRIRPVCSIEIGTYEGGSLAAIARYSGKVFTLDIDPGCRKALEDKFTNVEFITGPSGETLPLLLKRFEKEGTTPEFILIDGDHSRGGVKRDIENLLQIKPLNPIYVILHDSFNPGCRKGMLEAGWAQNPFVHFLEIDFVPGEFCSSPPRPPEHHRQMWCGFACALLLPTERKGPLEIKQSFRLMFETALKHSAHAEKPALYAFGRRAVKKFLNSGVKGKKSGN